MAFCIRASMCVLLIGAAACAKKNELRPPALGADAPPFSAQDLDGRPVTLAALHGKVVVLNEWATWCGPCLRELPQLQALHTQYADKGLVLVGVSIDAAGSGGDVREFAQSHGMTYPLWLDPDKQLELKFLTSGVPQTFVIDRDGFIRWHQLGALPAGDTLLASAIRRTLGS